MNNAAAVLNHVETLKQAGVDWNKAGVAGHGYTALGAMGDVANGLKQSLGFPPANVTEYYPPDVFEQEYNSAFESHAMGAFEWLLGNDAELPFDTAGTIWHPETVTCNWPSIFESSAPVDGTLIGLFHRGSNQFLTESASEVNENVGTYTGDNDDTFVLTNLGNNLVAFQASNGKYLSVPDASTRVAASSSTNGKNEKFIW